MKVAVLSSHTPSLCWFRMDMMREFVSRGHQVFAIGNEPEEQWGETFSKEGIVYRQITVHRNGTNPFQDIQTLLSIQKVLKQVKPDRLFLYQAKTVIYGAVAAKRQNIPAYPLIAGVGSVFLSESLKAKLVRSALVAEYRYALKGCKTIFFQNPDDVAIYRDGGMITGQNIVMLHGSGVNTERFSVAPLPKSPAFLCICRLIRDKGIREYLTACKRMKENHPEIRCMLVGPFDTNPTALTPEELRPYLDKGVVEYIGEQADVRPYLAQCSVYVLPSYREGTPKTVLEAMSCARAVITTDAPGCRETVVDGENGYLVPPRDADALYRKMEELALAPRTVMEMGMAGRRIVEEKFDVRKVNSLICSAMQL